MRLDELFIKQVLNDVSIIQGVIPNNPEFVVDSREVKPGTIFVALTGARADGHDFITQAFERGAAGVMIAANKKNYIHTLPPLIMRDKVIIVVPDPLRALIMLATAWRAQFTYPVVAITGSVGKTSTKEILATIVHMTQSSYLVSHGNQNTRIGISLNVLKMRANHSGAIFEIGINKRGEMAELVQIVKPTIAIITTIGHCHMEGLGSLHDIAVEKRDIFKYFTENNIGIINGDLPVLAHVSYTHPVIKFGIKTTNQIQARKVRIIGAQSSFTLKIYKEKYAIVLQQAHMGAIFNILAATAAAHLLGISHDIIVRAIQTPCMVPGRFEQRRLKRGAGGIIIHDCYNANPESMKVALLAFQHIETKAQKIAVIGDMLELGVNGPFWHRQLGRFLRKVPSLKQVILVGSMVHWAKRTAPVGVRVDIVASWKDAVAKLEEKLDQESVILVKGSRGVGLFNLVDVFSV